MLEDMQNFSSYSGVLSGFERITIMLMFDSFGGIWLRLIFRQRALKNHWLTGTFYSIKNDDVW